MENNKKIKMPKMKITPPFVMGFIVVVFALFYFTIVTFRTVPNENIAYLLIGNVSGALMTVLGTYFTGNSDSEKKEDKKNE